MGLPLTRKHGPAPLASMGLPRALTLSYPCIMRADADTFGQEFRHPGLNSLVMESGLTLTLTLTP